MGYQQKSYKKFVATAATATLVASAIVPVASAADFKDVAADSEFKPFIDSLTEKGIIKGYETDNTFRPGNKLTRGQVAIMLGRWLEDNGATVPTDWATNPRFSDVSSSNEELSKYAALVKEAGVFTGVGGKLNPNQNITRENMAVVLDRVAEEVAGVSLVELAEEVEEKEVTDLNKANADYHDEIQALVNLGISTVSNFRPKEEVSRAHFAKFLYTTIEIIEEVTAAPTADELKAEVASIVGTLPALTTITADNAEAAKTTAATATTALTAVETAIA
ncbi:MAG: S-layer homology domain-containing protein, partial [Lysinibacillus sp.]